MKESPLQRRDEIYVSKIILKMVKVTTTNFTSVHSEMVHIWKRKTEFHNHIISFDSLSLSNASRTSEITRTNSRTNIYLAKMKMSG